MHKKELNYEISHGQTNLSSCTDPRTGQNAVTTLMLSTVSQKRK